MIDVYITEQDCYGGNYLYRIFVDGEKYDTFMAKPGLTWSQQSDTVQTYRESLEYWRD